MLEANKTQMLVDQLNASTATLESQQNTITDLVREKAKINGVLFKIKAENTGLRKANTCLGIAVITMTFIAGGLAAMQKNPEAIKATVESLKGAIDATVASTKALLNRVQLS